MHGAAPMPSLVAARPSQRPVSVVMFTRSPTRIATIFRPASGNAALIALGVGLPNTSASAAPTSRMYLVPSEDHLQRLLKLPSIASGGDLPGGCDGSLNVRRGSVNDQAVRQWAPA